MDAATRKRLIAEVMGDLAKKGGEARASKLSAKRRKEIAKKAWEASARARKKAKES